MNMMNNIPNNIDLMNNLLNLKSDPNESNNSNYDIDSSIKLPKINS